MSKATVIQGLFLLYILIILVTIKDDKFRHVWKESTIKKKKYFCILF